MYILTDGSTSTYQYFGIMVCLFYCIAQVVNGQGRRQSYDEHIIGSPTTENDTVYSNRSSHNPTNTKEKADRARGKAHKRLSHEPTAAEDPGEKKSSSRRRSEGERKSTSKSLNPNAPSSGGNNLKPREPKEQRHKDRNEPITPEDSYKPTKNSTKERKTKPNNAERSIVSSAKDPWASDHNTELKTKRDKVSRKHANTGDVAADEESKRTSRRSKGSEVHSDVGGSMSGDKIVESVKRVKRRSGGRGDEGDVRDGKSRLYDPDQEPVEQVHIQVSALYAYYVISRFTAWHFHTMLLVL